jgi:hypothetical protein
MDREIFIIVINYRGHHRKGITIYNDVLMAQKCILNSAESLKYL